MINDVYKWEKGKKSKREFSGEQYKFYAECDEKCYEYSNDLLQFLDPSTSVYVESSERSCGK